MSLVLIRALSYESSQVIQNDKKYAPLLFVKARSARNVNALECIVRTIWLSILKSWVPISIYRAIENTRVFEKKN